MPSNSAFPGLPALGVSIALLCAPAAWAEDAACKTVRFADVGWSDIAATTGLASVVLEGLGYKPTVTMASVPIAFASIKAKQIDAFLGYWSPSMTPIIEPFIKAGQIRVLERPNLVGAKYTLAVPAYLYEKGLKTFADIAGFRKELDGKLHGIEPGNDGNALMQRMIDKNEYGLGGFRLVESSEAGMLAEVQRAARGSRAIVFLGWEPHPMNVQMKMKYLEGGDAVFGPNFGEAKVFTAIPPSYEARCPNVATLLKNLQFSTDVENAVMLGILEKARPNAAARAYLKKNPALLDGWLQGVKTLSGQDGLPAVAAALRR
ncbi:choline ABC transporter substrate-binding protein [Verminephrobacter aporrectodeae]|uniref:choline ABC transporter substrate-binding protein n=1 Tax=Verminephrobacter aporrectodeae TaxID=1110389 RepID=UPI002243DD6B|nr:choline ABC transporter substrate-binding protein [Verminephrobacter aporrectodeae]MCW8176824.1 choline ABC transporter substrate-binding protein [Verminephrobacter aporrectodeae subsp. tuberculatae]MCW8204135.1 choline ABC transporter substrate-binding protein [Verminephrobacter aporrectodeae subsp. tuberculatae]